MQLNEAKSLIERIAPSCKIFTLPITRAQAKYGIPEHAENWALVARLSYTPQNHM